MMNANDVAALLATVTVDQVMSVYSGKAGKCYCGCSGKHRYASKHVAIASKDRGYEVTPDEVNDRQVKKVLGIVKENFSFVLPATRPGSEPFHIQGSDGTDFVTHFSAEVDGRSYTVYLCPKA